MSQAPAPAPTPTPTPTPAPAPAPTPAPAPALDSKYSWVYQKLTENDKGQFNLESVVAYNLYKKNKIDFINQIKFRYKRDPNEQEWQTFHTQCELESSLKGYRNQATIVVSNLLSVAFASELSALESQELLESKVNAELDKLKIQLTTIDGYLNKRQGLSWWLSEVGKNFTVNVLTILLVGGLATLFINFSKILDWLKSLGA